MVAKMIDDILVRLHRPITSSWYQLPSARQAGLRWCLLLKNRGFKLSGFNTLFITLIENDSVHDVELELAGSPAFGSSKHLYCFVPKIPDDGSELATLTHRCIYDCLTYFCDKDDPRYELIVDVQKAVLETEQDAIPIRVSKSKEYVVSLGLRPSGPIPAGGEIILSVYHKVSQKTISRKLFDYGNYAIAIAFCGKLTILETEIKITGGALWKRLYPGKISEWSIETTTFLEDSDSEKWFLTDVSEIHGQLFQIGFEPKGGLVVM